MYDIVIIGAGVVGCAIAREVSRFSLRTVVLEKSSDVCSGSSKANSAIIHAGYDAKPGTLKGKLNAPANALFDKLSEELDFHFRRNGSLVLCFDEKDMGGLQELYDRGIANGVPDMRIISGDEVRQMEPNVTDSVVAALYAPTGGIVCPFNLTIAFAENACTNGVEFKFNSEVTNITKIPNGYRVETPSESYETRLVINAAGLYSDKMNNFVSKDTFKITPRRGEYHLFDKYVGNMAKCTLFQLPTKLGKGVLVSPTIDGNLIVGPNAVNIEDKEDKSTTRQGLDEIVEKALLSVKSLPMGSIITSFTGLRAVGDTGDFIIGEAPDAPGFINAAAIESPGLTSSPLIGEMVRDIVAEKLQPKMNPTFNHVRKGIRRFADMSIEEKREMLKKHPEYGRIVCRCESVTEGEILDAIRRPLGATNLDGIKRRTRAGAGRCQQGFCISRVMELLQSELGLSPLEITKFGGNSRILLGKNKEDF